MKRLFLALRHAWANPKKVLAAVQLLTSAEDFEKRLQVLYSLKLRHCTAMDCFSAVDRRIKELDIRHEDVGFLVNVLYCRGDRGFLSLDEALDIFIKGV